MKKSTVIVLLVAAIAAIVAIAGVGATIYYRTQVPPPAPPPPAPTIPQLPPGTQSFGNWTLVCNQAEGDIQRCGLLMRVINQEAQQVLMSVNLTRGGQGNAIFVINTPPGVTIPAGVSLTPENGATATGGVQVCRPVGCTGVILLSEMLLAEMSSVETTTISYTAANGQPVNIGLPTTGFTEGYGAWQMAYPAPPPAEEDAEAPAE
jgi:invasion protein IalB